MLAIYKKEIRTYFTSFVGYMFLAFFLGFVAVYQYIYNLYIGYANFAYAINGTTTFFLFLVPMLTMRIVAEDKRQKTDQLLFTSPVSISRIIIGKYLALLTVFAIAVVIVALYPLILRNYGPTSLSIAYSTLLAFFLLGSTYMAIGMLISALTESQIFAAVLTFVVILMTLLVDMLIAMLPTAHLVAFVVLLVCLLLVTVWTYTMMKNWLVTLGFGVLSMGGLTVAYVLKPVLFDGALVKVFGWFSFISRFENFRFGIFDPSAYVYYLSMSCLFVFLTIQVINKRRWEA